MVSRKKNLPGSTKSRAFTLIELLVVIGIISMLMAILLPSLGRAQEQAKIVVVNAELYGISVALEAYATNNHGKYPPTRTECSPDAREHAYALPQELIDKGYFSKGGEMGNIQWAKIEDRFYPGHTYKYIAVGPMYDFYGTPLSNQALYVPDGYPYQLSGEDLKRYKDPAKAPVTWAIFSIGPKYDIDMLEQGNFPVKSGFPLLKKFWYSPQTRKGILTRIRTKKARHLGTFESVQ